MHSPSDPIATVSASTPRRVFGVGVLGMLGLILLWTCFNTPPRDLGFAILMLVFGFGALYGAWRMWVVTERTLILDEAGLTDDAAGLMASWDEIERVDRGLLAFKPSNGFILTLRDKGARAWAPGLYWRVGRRIGVGGVTGAGQAKAMADLIAIRLAERDGV